MNLFSETGALHARAMRRIAPGRRVAYQGEVKPFRWLLAAPLFVLAACSSSPPPTILVAAAPEAPASASEPAPVPVSTPDATPTSEPAPLPERAPASTLAIASAAPATEPTLIPGPVLQAVPALAKTLGKTPPLPAWHSPAFDKSRDDLEQMIAEFTKGYTAEGAPIQGTLETFAPVQVNLKRGRCYRMVFRLKAGAVFSEWAKRGISFKYLKIDGVEVIGGPGIAGPGGVGSAGCVSRDATPMFDVQAIWRSAFDLSHLHDLGHGGFTAQLYGKVGSSAR